MSKHLALFVLLGLLLVFAAPASASPYSNEGLDIHNSRYINYNNHREADIFGYKVQEGSGEPPNALYAEFFLDLYCKVGGVTYVDVNQVVTVQEDYDWLEVSGDLGWGGLENRVLVYNYATGSWIWVTIDLGQFAYGPIYLDHGWYKRNGTSQSGVIDLPGSACDFNFEHGYSWGYNFKIGGVS